MNAWNPNEITKLSDALVGMHAELERQYLGEQSPFYQKYLSFRNSMMSWFGRQPLTGDQIMTMQIAVARDLNEAMTFLSAYAEQENGGFASYKNDLLINHGKELNNMQQRTAEYDQINETYHKLVEKIEKLSPLNEDYVPSKQQISFLKQKIRELKQSYRLSQRSVDHYLRIDSFSDDLIAAVSGTIDLCEQIAKESDMLVTDVEKFRTAPEIIAYQGQVSAAIEHAIGNISQHTMNIYNKMHNNIDKIVRAQDISQYRKHHTQGNTHFGKLVDHLSDADSSLRNSLDEKVGEYTGLKGI